MPQPAQAEGRAKGPPLLHRPIFGRNPPQVGSRGNRPGDEVSKARTRTSKREREVAELNATDP